jgi:hypothetical protein
MMKKFGLPVSDSFVEFNCVFAGLRESEPNLAGGFLLVDEWKTFRDRLGKYASYREPAQLKKWGDSVVVFHARNGNHVLMNPDGKLAWDVMQEQRVDEKWKSFDEFIEHYADYLDYNWPFDSYGPDEGRKKRRP